MTADSVNSSGNRSAFNSSRFGIPANQLHAASFEREGSLVWTVGTPSSNGTKVLTHNDLNGFYFLGPPLAYENNLYCITESRGEIRLVVLEAESGQLLWSQQLCQTSGITAQLARRSQALSPAISDGILVCPTGANLLVALDLDTRSLRWAFSYQPKRQANRPLAFNGMQLSSSYNPTEPNWQDSGLQLSQGTVTLTPVETPEFHLRDLATGKEQIRIDRGRYRYLAGTKDNLVVLVSEKNIFCIDRDTNNAAWNVELPQQARLAGRALMTATSLIVPLQPNRLMQISLADGEVIEEVTVDEPIGNLFSHRGTLISATATSVSAYYTQDELRSEVLERLASDEDDVEALNLKAQLSYAAGEVEQVFESLGESLKINPENIDTRSLIVEIILNGLESDFDLYRPKAKEFESLLMNHPRRGDYLKWIAVGHVRAGNVMPAFDALTTLMRDRITASQRILSNSSSLIRLSKLHQANVDVWIAAKFASLYDEATPEQRKLMDNTITETLSGLENLILSQQLLRLRYFIWHPTAEKPIINLALAYGRRDMQLGLEKTLRPLLLSANPDTAELALRMLSQETVADQNLLAPQGALLGRMYGPSGQFQPENLNSQDRFDRDSNWNRGNMLFAVRSQRSALEFGTPIQLQSRRFSRPEIAVRFQGNELIIVNSNGERLTSFRLNQVQRSGFGNIGEAVEKARIVGGLLLVETASEIAAFDLYRGLRNSRDALLWRRSVTRLRRSPSDSFREISQERTTALGISMPSSRPVFPVGPLTPAGLILNYGTEVVCIDPYTGRPNWTREGYLQVSRILADGTDIAVVDSELGISERLDARDGSEILADRQNFRNNLLPLHCYGRLALDYRQTKDQLRASADGSDIFNTRFRIWNPFTNETLVEYDQLPSGSRAAICEDRFFVLAIPGQGIEYFDLEKEKQFSFGSKDIEDLESIVLQRFGSRLLVGLKTLYSNFERDQITARNKTRSYLRPIHGEVYALDIETGNPLWQTPAKIWGMFFPVSQPRNSPFVSLFRFNSTTQDQSCNLVLLDLRDGKIAHSVPQLPVDLNTGFAMILRPITQSIEVMVGNMSFTYRATDLPRAPRPIANYGAIFMPIENPSLELDATLPSSR